MATAREDQAPGVKAWLLGAGSVVAVLATVKLLLHLYAGRHYGYFVDELYYLACAQHLDWGYVDPPPLIALIAKIARSLLGDSLSAIRLFRALAWAWLIAAGLIVALNPRVYYLFPAFPLLFAAGGAAWERWLAAPRLRWVKPAYVSLMVLMAALLAPSALPLLPAETYIRYSTALHLQPPRIETFRLGPMPQLYADQFGWEQMAAAVAGVFKSLPPEVRARTCIFGQNYGQAGAVDLFGPRYGLPRAISGHQSYFLWGPHGCTGESVIVMAGRRQSLEREYTTVRKTAHVKHPYSMPYEHFDVFYCQGLKVPVSEAWPRVKRWE